MKYFTLLLYIIPVLSFSRDNNKIENFINNFYGDDYYFLEKRPKSLSVDDLDEGWESVLSKGEIEAYRRIFKQQSTSVLTWETLSLKKAILCENGKPIVSEKNIPLECIIFISNTLGENEKREIINSVGANHFIIFYDGKNISDAKKKKEYYTFLKKFDRNKVFSSLSFSIPVFFSNYSILKSSSKYNLETCVYKLSQSSWNKLNCARINY